MSKASKVSHFHSTTYSAHRGGVAHATLGRPMAPPSAPAPGTVGAMTPKFKPQAQCVSFASPSETMQQYANRVLGGSLAKLDGRMLMAGKMQASETIGQLARKSVGNRNWANVTANEVFIAAFHQPMPAGMPVATCAWTERASLDWYGVVHGTDEEADPTGVGAMTPKFKPQAQCVPFFSVFETMQEYADRVLGGNVSALNQRFLMWGGKGDNLDAAMDSVAGYAMKASQKAFGSNRYWTSMRAGAVFSAAFNQPVPSGMPIGTCAKGTLQQDQTSFGSGGGKGYSLQKRGTVTGAEEEADPTGVGAMTPKFKYADRGSYIAFSSPDETMQQYANRVAHGSLTAIAGRQVLIGGKLEIGHIGELAKKAASSLRSPMGWGGVTVRQMYAAGGAVIVPGMPIGSWPSKDDYAASYAAVNGAEGTVGDFIDDAGDWVSTVVQESQNAFYNPDGQSGYTPPSANPGDNQTAAEQCANLGPGWSWSADRNDCVNFQREAQACVDAGNTWDDVAGQCRSNNCPPGSHSNPDIPGCIPDKIPCGANSFQSGDKCLCEKGFEFKDMVSLDCVPIGQGWQSAIKKCGPGTHNDPNVGGCVCDQGYIFDTKRTTADTLVCGKAECGANSVLGPDGCRCKPGYDWVDPANIDNLDCKKVGGNGGGPVTPPAPKCGPGTHVDSATNTCVVDETAQVEPTKAEDNTWKWVAGIAAAVAVVGGGTYLAMKKKGKKSALQAKLSSHSTQTDVS